MKTQIVLFLIIGIIQINCIQESKSIDFPSFLQKDITECGPVCLKMIAQHYGRTIDLKELKQLSNWNDSTGTTLLGLKQAAESIGLKSIGAPINYERLADDIPLPAIVHWEENHFVVVYKVDANQAWVADPNPSIGKTIYSKAAFCKGWLQKDESKEGIIFLLEPTDKFVEDKG